MVNRGGYNIGREDNTPKGPEVPYTATALGGGNTYNSASSDSPHQVDSIKVHNEKVMEYAKEIAWRTWRSITEILQGIETNN
jgi:hypothetical protein